MHVTVSSRHSPLDPGLGSRARMVLERLSRVGERAIEGAAVFDVVSGRPWVELRLHCTGGKVLVATAEDPDHRSALDRAERRIRRQLRRVQTRPLSHRHETVTVIS